MDVDVRPYEEFKPPEGCGDERCRDYFMEFVYCFLIPAGVVVLISIFIMVCFICSCCKKKQPPDQMYEMECYNTIRRASQSLRDLSNKRDTLLEPRSGSMSLPRNGASHRSRRACHSAPNTLQRDRRRQEIPPPAYQQLPVYPSSSGQSIEDSYDYPPSSYMSPGARNSDFSSFRGSASLSPSHNRYSMT